jgi:hypothetical protein
VLADASAAGMGRRNATVRIADAEAVIKRILIGLFDKMAIIVTFDI